MQNIFKITLLGLLAGTIGTGMGGILSFFVQDKQLRFLSFVLELSAGMMMAVVCFDLLPEAFDTCNLFTGLLGVVFGIICVLIPENKFTFKKNDSLLHTSMLLLVTIAIHNFPEGLAIGSAFDSSARLGINLVIVILLHNIPEGFAVGLPMKVSGINNLKILIYTVLSGIPMGIGALFGCMAGKISSVFVSVSLGFAGGAMLYVISGELIPRSKSLYRGRFSSLGNIFGIILGILISHM